MINPRDFQQTAKEILSKTACTGEAAARTACGRAYYAVYLEYRAAIRSQVGDSSYDFRHESLRDILNTPIASIDQKIRSLAKYVGALVRLRTDADYRPRDATVSESDAKASEVNCDGALRVIAQFRSTKQSLPVPVKWVKPI